MHIVKFLILGVLLLLAGRVHAYAYCEKLSQETESSIRKFNKSPFQLYYVGHEVVGGDRYVMQRLSLMPYGSGGDGGVQPFWYYNVSSQMICLEGDYAGAADYVKTLAQAYVEQGKITALKFAGMRDGQLIIEGDYKLSECARHSNNCSNSEAGYVCDCEAYAEVVRSGSMVFSHCPTERTYHHGGHGIEPKPICY